MCTSFVGENTMVVVSGFALGWFLVGILAGTMLKGRHAGRSGGASRDGSGGSSGSGDTELYVGNMAYEVTEKDLDNAFSAFGKVSSIRIISNKMTNKSKGYGFVEMVDHDQAMDAVRAMNGKDLKGRRIVVNEAKSKPRD